MTIPKVKKDKRKTRRAVKAAPSKAINSPPADKMVKQDDKCAWCGRRMLDIRCQCGYVRPRNK